MVLFQRSLLLSTFLVGLIRRSYTCLTMSGECLANKTINSYQAGTHSVAYITTPSEEVAKNLAKSLVGSKLAACVNIIPKVTSIYEWEGTLNEDSEALMMIKTRTAVVDELIEHVKKNHPYTVPEVIVLPIATGNEAYLKWVGESVPLRTKH